MNYYVNLITENRNETFLYASYDDAYDFFSDCLSDYMGGSNLFIITLRDKKGKIKNYYSQNKEVK